MLVRLVAQSIALPKSRSGCAALLIRSYSSRSPSGNRHLISEGRTTRPSNSELPQLPRRSPYYFDTGFAAFAKRPTRPFPPPFLSYPSGSFSDPLTTHNRPQYRQPKVDGQLLRGLTNGDDAVLIDGHNLLVVNDGVGAWAQKAKGHAALWSRLIAHYWAAEVEQVFEKHGNSTKDFLKLADIDPVACLDAAYGRTKDATAAPEILGTTTASSALLHHRSDDEPVALITTLGDCATLVIRPSNPEAIYKSEEQWHWFDCPRQLGTNSPDTPKGNGVVDMVDLQEGDLVLCVSDGVTDNLWEHEITERVRECVQRIKDKEAGTDDGTVYIARTIMNAAREIAQDPYAESPYMERALDEGIAAEGGKLDDITVAIGVCRRHSD